MIHSGIDRIAKDPSWPSAAPEPRRSNQLVFAKAVTEHLVASTLTFPWKAG